MADRSHLLTSKQMASFVTNGFLRFDSLVPDELNQAATIPHWKMPAGFRLGSP